MASGFKSTYIRANHMFINDIYKLSACTNGPGYDFRGVPIRKVQVMGVVTKISSFQEKKIFYVDDGTGTISCYFSNSQGIDMFNKASKIKKEYKLQRHTQTSQAVVDLASYLQKNIFKSSQFSVGSALTVIGYIYEWRDGRGIMVNEITRIDSILTERKLRRFYVYLYENVYNNPGIWNAKNIQ